MTVSITGYSDDLIEVDGDISAEFTCPSDDKAYLGFSDGTLLKIWYDEDGIWRINRLVDGLSYYSKEEGSVERDTFDIAHLEDVNIKWVLIGKDHVTKYKEKGN